jgi:hypothetical protein
MRYCDASALVKRYVREKGSLKIRRLLSSGTAATSRYSPIEVASALARRTRDGALSEAERDKALAALDEDMTAFVVVELTDDIVTRAQALLRRHPLRAGDAIQLASCVHLRDQLADDVSLVAFDDRLVAAARKERVRLG